jgi:glutathione synthase/RimK-type ligase-like ATP-grasp enzyme
MAQECDPEAIGFELVGFDFIISESLEVLLVEVNQNPCLSTLSEDQGTLISKLLDDTLR